MIGNHIAVIENQFIFIIDIKVWVAIFIKIRKKLYT